MSIMLQLMFVVLFLGIIYASYVHNTDWYHKIFVIFPDFHKLWNRPEFVKIEVLVHHSHAEMVKNTIKAYYPGTDPVIITKPDEAHAGEVGGHASHGH